MAQTRTGKKRVRFDVPKYFMYYRTPPAPKPKK